MPTFSKLAANLARIQADGIKNMGEITRLLGKVYPAEENTAAAIHTAQMLKAAGVTTETAEMQSVLAGHFDNDGVKLGAAIIEQGITWLLKQTKKRDTQMSERETDAVQNCGGIVWSNTFGVYSQRTGQIMYHVPVFTVYNAQNRPAFEYYVLGGKLEIFG